MSKLWTRTINKGSSSFFDFVRSNTFFGAPALSAGLSSSKTLANPSWPKDLGSLYKFDASCKFLVEDLPLELKSDKAKLSAAHREACIAKNIALALGTGSPDLCPQVSIASLRECYRAILFRLKKDQLLTYLSSTIVLEGIESILLRLKRAGDTSDPWPLLALIDAWLVSGEMYLRTARSGELEFKDLIIEKLDGLFVKSVPAIEPKRADQQLDGTWILSFDNGKKKWTHTWSPPVRK